MSAVGYGVGGTVVFVVCLLLLIRFRLRQAPGIPVLLVEWVCVGIATLLVIVLVERSDTLILILTNLAVYAALVELLIFIYGVASGSVSVGILASTVEHEAQADAFERALAAHSAERLFEYRLQRLTEQQLLARTGDAYQVTEKGRTWARVGSALKSLLAVGSGG